MCFEAEARESPRPFGSDRPVPAGVDVVYNNMDLIMTDLLTPIAMLSNGSERVKGFLWRSAHANEKVACPFFFSSYRLLSMAGRYFK